MKRVCAVFAALLLSLVVICGLTPKSASEVHAGENYTELVMETKEQIFGLWKSGMFNAGDAIPGLNASDFIVKSLKAGETQCDTSDASIDNPGAWFTVTNVDATTPSTGEFVTIQYCYKLRIKFNEGHPSASSFKVTIDGVTFKASSYTDDTYILRSEVISISPSGNYSGKLNSAGTVKYKYDPTSKILRIFRLYGSGEMSDDATSSAQNLMSQDAMYESIRSNCNTVVIEDGVTSVGSYLFYKYNNLSTVDMADSVESLGSYAFSEDEKISEIKLPENLKVIGESCFRYSWLKAIKIPEGTEEIKKDAFSGCQYLSTVEMPKEMKTLESAFAYCRRIEKIEIPTGITKLYGHTFDNCMNLKEVILPDTLEELGKGEFENCVCLKKIAIPDSVKTIVGMDDDSSYNLFTYVSNVVVTANPGTVGAEYALKKKNLLLDISPVTVSGLKSVEYTGSATTQSITISFGEIILEENKDYTVSYLNNIEIGAAKVRIQGMGKYDGKLEKTFDIVPIDFTRAEIGQVEARTYTGKEITPEVNVKLNGKELKLFTDYTLAYKDNVNPGTAVVIVTGKGHYKGSLSKEFTINPKPEEKTEAKKENTTEVKKEESKAVEEGTTIIDEKAEAIYVVLSVETKDASDSTKSVPPTVEYKGTKDKKAKKVVIPDTVTIDGVTYTVVSVAANALKGSKYLTSLVIGKNIKTIGKNAFADCPKLTTVNCKSTVLTKIGAGAFKGDKKLSKFTLKSAKLTKKSVGKNAFKGTSGKLVFKVPKKAKKNYSKFFKTKGNKKVKVK